MSVRFLLVVVGCALSIALVHGDACVNPVFSNTTEWSVDPAFSDLSSLLATPQPFPNSVGSCSYFAGQDVCCSSTLLAGIDASLGAARNALTAASTAIDTDTLFTQLEQVFAAMNLTEAAADDFKVMKSAVSDLAEAQVSCLSSLINYTEGMLCFACSTNATAYLNTSEHAFIVSENTCSGVVQSCNATFTTIRSVMTSTLRIFILLGLTNDTMTIDNVPDMCGGTVAAPGNCTGFVCDEWLQGVRTPAYNWSAAMMPNLTEYMLEHQTSIAPAAFANALHDVVATHLAARTKVLEGLRAQSTVRNVYSVNGYDALSVGQQSLAQPTAAPTPAPEEGNKHTLAIALGAAGGALVLLAVVALVVRRGRSRSVEADQGEGSMLVEGQKATYA